MKRASPFAQITEALGGEQGLREFRNFFGIPSFCYQSPIGWMDIIADGDRISHVSFSETPPPVGHMSEATVPVLVQVIEKLTRYFDGEPVDFFEISLSNC